MLKSLTKFSVPLISKEIKEGEYLGKVYKVSCLPEYYEQIVWFLTTKLGYVDCNYDTYVKYAIKDDSDKKITLSKAITKTEWRDLQ